MQGLKVRGQVPVHLEKFQEWVELRRLEVESRYIVEAGPVRLESLQKTVIRKSLAISEFENLDIFILLQRAENQADITGQLGVVGCAKRLQIQAAILRVPEPVGYLLVDGENLGRLLVQRLDGNPVLVLDAVELYEFLHAEFPDE